MKMLLNLSLVLPFLLMNCTTDTESTFSLTWADTSAAFPYTDAQVQKMIGKNLVTSTTFYDDSLLMVGFTKGSSFGPQYATSSNPAYELSTNDTARARNLADAMYRNANGLYAVHEMGTTEKFFQFRGLGANGTDLWYRVHKSSYVDRSMCVNNQDLSKDGPIAQLAVVPVTISANLWRPTAICM
jgi:hypothetical protein